MKRNPSVDSAFREENNMNHEPLLTDNQILDLLTPVHTAPVRSSKTTKPLWKRSSFAVPAAAFLTCCVATVLVLQTTNQTSTNVNAVQPKDVAAKTASSQSFQSDALGTSDVPQSASGNYAMAQKLAEAEVNPSIVAPQEFLEASADLLKELGISVATNKIQLVEDGQRITVTPRGISLKPTTDKNSEAQLVAITLYEVQQPYATWCTASTAQSNFNALVPVSITLQTPKADVRQNVRAVLWFEPATAKTIEPNVTSYQVPNQASPKMNITNVYPNPCRGFEAQITIELQQATTLQISLFDMQGVRVTTAVAMHSVQAGQHTYTLSNLSELPSGMLLIVVDAPSIGQQLVQRFLIER